MPDPHRESQSESEGGNVYTPQPNLLGYPENPTFGK